MSFPVKQIVHNTRAVAEPEVRGAVLGTTREDVPGAVSGR